MLLAPPFDSQPEIEDMLRRQEAEQAELEQEAAREIEDLEYDWCYKCEEKDISIGDAISMNLGELMACQHVHPDGECCLATLHVACAGLKQPPHEWICRWCSKDRLKVEPAGGGRVVRKRGDEDDDGLFVVSDLEDGYLDQSSGEEYNADEDVETEDEDRDALMKPMDLDLN
jgi:hypothetical protein